MKFSRLFLFAALFAATAGFGQTSPGDIVVNVPFDFSVAGETFPSGNYVIASGNDMIRIFNAHTRGLFVPTHAASRTRAEGSKLVFHRYGNSYFLAAVWITGNTTGKELFASSAERELKTRQAEMELAVVRPAE